VATATFTNTIWRNSTLAVGHSTPNGQGSFIYNSRVEAYTNFTVQVATSGGATYSIQLEGSTDNLNWFVIGTPITADGVYSVNGGGIYATWVRFNVTAVNGGTTPEITATYIAID
jgi:hypothetical protein